MFSGAVSRVEATYGLAKEGLAESLVISPATEQSLRFYKNRYGLPDSVNQVLEPKARTTFENALLCGEIIKREGWNNVILVTHEHHMPRSYFLLRWVLLGEGVEIQRYGVPLRSIEGREVSTTIDLKIMYNEMVDLWGSLGEWVLYKIRGRLPDKGNREQQWLKKLKSILHFNLHEDWG
ncbi:protein of unknown function DUF218 [Desulfatibacillum aliphaticivorans]|uniref:DUF218 domain-containing protein n=1 Tax=Desulfatibacillum aliphaticivorans TaxID=218208 RepID=B8F9T6_DESAL|nr:protein of unknown function DUF218 [Desulfatibacillum aliphaticivorans]